MSSVAISVKTTTTTTTDGTVYVPYKIKRNERTKRKEKLIGGRKKVN